MKRPTLSTKTKDFCAEENDLKNLKRYTSAGRFNKTIYEWIINCSVHTSWAFAAVYQSRKALICQQLAESLIHCYASLQFECTVLITPMSYTNIVICTCTENVERMGRY